MKLFVVILSCLLIPVAAAAGSTALSASKFTVQGEPDTVVSESLRVSNLSNSVQQYRFYSEESGETARKSLSIAPSDFKLPPRQSVDVVLRFRQTERPYQINLNLVAYGLEQLNSNFRVGDGIRIPVIFQPPQVAGASVFVPQPGRAWLGWNILVFGIDFILFFIVCYWYWNRCFWQRRRLNHKISFL